MQEQIVVVTFTQIFEECISRIFKYFNLFKKAANRDLQYFVLRFYKLTVHFLLRSVKSRRMHCAFILKCKPIANHNILRAHLAMVLVYTWLQRRNQAMILHIQRCLPIRNSDWYRSRSKNNAHCSSKMDSHTDVVYGKLTYLHMHSMVALHD